MIKIIKEKSYVGTLDIRLEINENIHLDIVYGNVGDVYWIYDNLNMLDVKDDPMYEVLKITKEDIDIYNIFNELYEDIINCRIHIPRKTILSNEYDKLEEQRCHIANEKLKNDSLYKKLVKDDVITWYSDEECEEITEILRISKREEIILIEFIRQSRIDGLGQTRMPGWYSIRFRSSGSYYQPCDTVFWRHFDNLQNYESSNNLSDDTKNNTKKLIP